MSSTKKATRTIRSREDHDLFKITYPQYDPQTASTIQLHLAPGDYLSPGAPIATVHLLRLPNDKVEKQEQNQMSFVLSTYVAGKVQKIGGSFSVSENGYKLRQGQKKGSVQLVHIRQCEHIINNQSINNANITLKSENPTPRDICPRCGKHIEIYYQKQEQNITIQALLAANTDIQLEELRQLEWSIILNEQFTPNTTIAKVSDKQLKLPILAKATFLVGSGEKPVNNVIMKIRRASCKHEKIIGNRCQNCLQLIDYSQVQQFSRYLFQFGPNGIGKSVAKGSALLHQEQEYINSLLSKRRLILILDLDNTILHSNEMNQLELKDLLRLRDYFLIPKFQQSAEGQMKQDYIVVKMRPYIKEFLFIIGRMFEVYIYTKGTRIYADSICRWVRHQWAGDPTPYDINTWSQPQIAFLKNTQCFAPHRIISRNEDMNLESKSMQNILPTRTQYHLILDDRRDVWSNSPSWFFTREYYCFFRRPRNPSQICESIDHFLEDNTNENCQPYVAKLIDCYNQVRQNYPEKSESQVNVSQKPDFFLLFAAHALKKIHLYFFDQLKKAKEEKTQSAKNQKSKEQKKTIVSLSYLLQRMKVFLKGKTVRFFTAPSDESQSTARRAIKLGASLLTNNDSQKPDYIIRGNNYMSFIKKWREERKIQQNKGNQQQQAIDIEVQSKTKRIQKQKTQEHSKRKIQQQLQQKVQTIFPEQKGTINFGPQTNKKLKNDFKIQQQMNQPKSDYDIQLEQLQKLHQQGVPVIAETWILACYEYTYKFNHEHFKLEDPFKEDVEHSLFDTYIAKCANKIRIEINDQLGKQFSDQHEKKDQKQTKELFSNNLQKQKACAQEINGAQRTQKAGEQQKQFLSKHFQSLHREII